MRKKHGHDGSPWNESQPSRDSSVRRRVADRLGGAVFVLVLACVAGRATIAEIPFRVSAVRISEISALAERGQTSVKGLVDRQELTRAGFAAVLLAAGVLWLLAGAIEGKLRVRYPFLAVLVGAWAGWSFLSAWRAADARAAWLAWMDQVSLLSAGFVVLQLCNSRRRFLLLAAVLAAVGTSQAAKGWMQFGWEHADSARYFDLYGPRQLADMGLQPDEPKAAAYRNRVLSTKLTGYIGLSNMLAAGMLLTLAAAAGLAWAKALYARHLRRRDGPLPAGHIRPAFLAAVLMTILTAATAGVFVLTRCCGAVGAAGGVVLTAAAAWRFRETLARRWKACVLLVAVAVVLAAAGVTAYGLARGRLPGKTMTVRWFYWTGAAEIVREHPFLGVGAGNFPEAYLRVRRPQAEEAVKDPHNVLAHAATQYGLPGAALYLAVLCGMLVLAWKPARDTATETQTITRDGAPAPPRHDLHHPHAHHDTHGNTLRPFVSLPAAACLVLMVFFCRGFLNGAGEEPVLLLLEGVAPAVVFAIGLALAGWFGGSPEDLPSRSIRAIRLALAAGASAFAIHESVSYGLWMPGTAGLFWTAAAGAAAMGTGREFCVKARGGRWIPPVLGAAGVAAVIVCLVAPVALRLAATREAAEALLAGDTGRAAQAAQRAAGCDPADALAAADAARFCTASRANRRQRDAAGEPLALSWAREAIRRDDSAGSYRLAARIAQELEPPKAGAFWRGAVRRDPADARLRLDWAAWLADHHQPVRAAEQIEAAEDINRRLGDFDPQSVYLFGRREKNRIAAIRRNIAAK
ncbi:MAG: O-antigen ligase family protein [Phycisphaerae bacterium]|nr:O-antigen ligase family protein [Phycisphaerae bacterium]